MAHARDIVVPRGDALGLRLGQVMDVRGRTVTRNLTRTVAPRSLRFQGFRLDDGSALTNARPSRSAAKRSASGRGERLEGVESRQNQLASGVIPTGEDAPGASGTNHLERGSDGVRSGRASVGDNGGAPLDPKGIRQVEGPAVTAF